MGIAKGTNESLIPYSSSNRILNPGDLRRFAFLDFRTIPLATAALLDPRNYSMDGRELKLEYAGADAVRRSGLQPKPAVDSGRRSKGKRFDAGEGVDTIEEGSPAKRAKLGKQKEGSGKQHRLRPGAALATAQREQTAIVPSEGKKTKF